VAPPSDPGSDEYPERYSIAFFSNPDWDADISALPGCVAAGEGPKYPAVGLAHLPKRGVTARKQINAHQYLVQRLSATY
jgi:isopenicillin N synthase-like dioxygenase